MYNEYPDLVLEGLMYDLSIVQEQESDNGNKNIFQKFIAFLKRIGAWFVKMFKKLADKFRGAEKNSGELTDEELSKIEVTNYDIPMIEKFIRSYEGIFKKMDEIVQLRQEISDDDYKNIDKAQDYIEMVQNIKDSKQNDLVTDKLEINKFKSSFEEKTKCNKKIYNFMQNTFKTIEKSGINDISAKYAQKFSYFKLNGGRTRWDENFPKGFLHADSSLMHICTNIMNFSAKILTQIYDDLIHITNNVKNGSERVNTPKEVSTRGSY